MSGFELNKIAAAILLAGVIAMMAGFISKIIYKTEDNLKVRGYSVATTEDEPIAVAGTQDVGFNIQELMKKANAETGKALAKKCISCHSFVKEEGNKIGPNLHSIYGETKAKAPNYKYSSAMAAQTGIWDEVSLFPFLHKPMKDIPGTKMSFAGFAKGEDIADVIAYLKTLTN